MSPPFSNENAVFIVVWVKDTLASIHEVFSLFNVLFSHKRVIECYCSISNMIDK